jgi:acyl-CoA hydrolase
MELKGTKTEEILSKAFSGELQASFRYRYIAEIARNAGLKQVADIFEATAHNEVEHARHEFEFLGGAGDIENSIKQAIHGESDEATKFYPDAAETAQEEGFHEIAAFFRRMSKVEEKHERNFRDLLTSVEQGKQSEGNTVGHSVIEMAQVTLPEQANPAGFVHGGEMMKLMDNAAGVVGVRHSGSNVVTGSVENLKFINPVRVGDLVIVHGKLVFVSHSSMEVQVDVEIERLFGNGNGEKLLALTAFFVMVALDPDGKAKEIPPLILSTEEEERLFAEGQERYQSRKKSSSTL